MSKFNNPLENIHIASPCPANWDEMYGDDRKRHCGSCKMNVYNLSDMTRREAEDLLVNSEGRLCVRFFRRADGSILNQNCPVGWAAVKQRVSRVATAAFSMIAGLSGGLFALSLFREQPGKATMGEMVVEPQTVWHTLPQVGETDGIQKMGGVEKEIEYLGSPVVGALQLKKSRATRTKRVSVRHGGVVEIGRLPEARVILPKGINGISK